MKRRLAAPLLHHLLYEEVAAVEDEEESRLLHSVALHIFSWIPCMNIYIIIHKY